MIVRNKKNKKILDEAQQQLDSLRIQIDRVYKQVILADKSDTKKDTPPIEMLKEMETKLDHYIRELKYFRTLAPDMVLAKEKVTSLLLIKILGMYRR